MLQRGSPVLHSTATGAVRHHVGSFEVAPPMNVALTKVHPGLSKASSTTTSTWATSSARPTTILRTLATSTTRVAEWSRKALTCPERDGRSKSASTRSWQKPQSTRTFREALGHRPLASCQEGESLAERTIPSARETWGDVRTGCI